MKTHTKERTYEGVARAAWDLAQQETQALERIEQLLQAGDSEAALVAMKAFFGHKKPPMEDHRLYETEDKKQVV